MVWRVNCPYTGEGELLLMDGRIAIRPYTCVIRTLANIHINHVNTQKRRHGHGMRAFACVVGAKSASWRSGVCDAIRPYCKFIPYCKIHPCCKIHPHYNSPTPQFAYIAPLKLQGQGGAKGVMCRFPDGEHREGGRGLWYGLFYGEGLFSFS